MAGHGAPDRAFRKRLCNARRSLCSRPPSGNGAPVVRSLREKVGRWTPAAQSEAPAGAGASLSVAQLGAVPAGAQCGPDTRQPGNMPARFPPRRNGKAALAATGAEA